MKYVPLGENAIFDTFALGISAKTFQELVLTILTLNKKKLVLDTQLKLITR